jgi:hypothetical protein
MPGGDLLRDPSAQLSPAARAFLDELRQMLDLVRPRQLDAARTGVEADSSGIEVRLAHLTKSEWDLWASVDERHIIAGASGIHEHFDRGEDSSDRPWTSQAVDFIAELLRGEIEIQTTYRGKHLLRAEHFLLPREGSHEKESLGVTGLLSPGWLRFWLPKRVEVERVSFDAEG